MQREADAAARKKVTDATAAAAPGASRANPQVREYDVMWCDVMWCDMISCDVIWCDIIYYDIICCSYLWGNQKVRLMSNMMK